MSAADYPSMNDPRLNGREKASLYNLLKKNARSACEDYARLIGECTRGRTVSVVYHCRDQVNAFNECLKRHTTDDEFRKLRDVYLDNKERLLQERYAATHSSSATPST